MRLVFRADASAKIGAGHVMRCSAIAEEAIARGIPCILLGTLGGLVWIEDRLIKLGVDVIPVEKFQRINKDDVLIIDSYSLPVHDALLLSQNWKSVIVVADEYTPYYKADLVFHPGLDDSWFKGSRENFFFGPMYIPIRKSITKNVESRPGNLKKIVVFGGGTDIYKFGQHVSSILHKLSGFEKVVFFSDQNEYISDLDSRFVILPFGPILDQELSDADLVLTSASTSSLEVIIREIPVGIASLVENQNAYYESLGNSGVAAQIGLRTPTGDWKIDGSKVEKLISDSCYREELRIAARDFIDFFGAKRIVDKIIGF